MLGKSWKDIAAKLQLDPDGQVARAIATRDTWSGITVQWPAERKVVELGTVTLTEKVADDAHEQKNIIFDPIPRLDGIEPSDDPLLELRAATYLISGRRRRAAPEQ